MSTRSRRTRLAILLLISAALVAAASAPPASAWTASGNGCFGGSTIPFAQGAVYQFQLPQVQFPERTVRRAPCSRYTQKITVTWQISQWQRSSLTYTPYASTTSTVIVRLGKVAIFRPKALEVLPPHYYTATLTTVWRRLSGRTIAYRVHQYVSPGDYRCYGTGGQCLIGAQGGRANVYLDTIAF